MKSIVEKFLNFPFSHTQKRLCDKRPKMNQEKFVQKISGMGGDTEAAILVHQKLQDWIYVKKFTPYPEDDLERTFGIAEEELDEDLILEILNLLKIKIPSREHINKFGPIKTPADISKFVALSRSVSRKADSKSPYY